MTRCKTYEFQIININNMYFEHELETNKYNKTSNMQQLSVANINLFAGNLIYIFLKLISGI